MAIRALYETKDAPLPIAIDYYKIIYESLSEKSQDVIMKLICDRLFSDYLLSGNNPEESMFEKWADTKNNLFFTRGFRNLFESDEQMLWIAYSALEMLFDAFSWIGNESREAAYLQVYYYDKTKFWIINEGRERIVFLLPDEY